MLWVAFQRFGTMGLSFVSNIILARLLTPDDFGSIGLLAIFIALSNTFIDGGFGAALIQKENPTREDASTIFIWNICLSLILYAVIFFCAPLIADFYDKPILGKLLQVQALILITNALSVVPRSILRKRLQFNHLAIIDLSASVIGVSTGIVLAFRDWGVWSLVAYQLTTTVCQVIGLWYISQWHPSLKFNLQSFKSLFKYGSYLLISDLMNSFCDNIQGLVIGKQFSSATMGYYSQARKLEEVPTTSLTYVISQVVFPVFSKIKENNDSLQTAHKQCIHAAAYINIPLMLLPIIIAQPLILMLLTEKWIAAVPFFQILCLSGAVNSLQSINYHLYVAKGYSKSMFKWNLFKRCIGVALILLGAIIGIKGLLWGMVIGFWITYIVNACLAGNITGYTLSKQLYDLTPIIGSSLIAGGLAYTISLILPHHHISTMIIQIFIFTATYILLSLLFKLKGFNTYLGLLQKVLRRV